MKQFTEKDLVDFGNQLLSKEREVLHEINLHQVTDADIAKFEDGRERKIKESKIDILDWVETQEKRNDLPKNSVKLFNSLKRAYAYQSLIFIDEILGENFFKGRGLGLKSKEAFDYLYSK